MKNIETIATFIVICFCVIAFTKAIPQEHNIMSMGIDIQHTLKIQTLNDSIYRITTSKLDGILVYINDTCIRVDTTIYDFNLQQYGDNINLIIEAK